MRPDRAEGEGAASTPTAAPLPHALPQAFYARDARTVARELLGKVLVRELGGRVLRARIVETEAYLGPQDLASHARFGKTGRNFVMFGPGGHAYVYFIYGMHSMLNISASEEGKPQAVLLRAAQAIGWATDLGGPGRLCRALNVDRALNGHDLTQPPLWLEPGPRPRRILRTPRVGIDYAGSWADKKLRYLAPA